MRKWMAGLVAVLFACSGAITLLVRNSNGAVKRVETTQVSRGPIADTVVAIGSVQPDTSVSVKAKVSGIVEWVGAEPGDPVEAGEIIVELDKDILRGEVAAAEAEVAVARAALAQAGAEADAAATEDEFQQSEYERAVNLRERGLISPQEVESRRTAHRAAEQQARRAAAMLKAAEARLEKAQVALQLARDRLSYATLRSPITGVLLSRPVEVGTAVADVTAYAQDVFTVGDMSTLLLDAEVDETEVGRVRLGQQARITLEAFADRMITGTVTRIAPQGVEENNIVRFAVEITLDPAAVPLRAQLTGDAEIIVDEREDTLLLDERAIRYDYEGPYAIKPGVEADSEPQTVRLTLGYSNGQMAEVLAGLREGDTVLLKTTEQS